MTTSVWRATASSSSRLPGSGRALLLIARRGALESLRDRMTIMVNTIFALVVPVSLTLTTVRPLVATGAAHGVTLGSLLAIYLLVVGLLPTNAAVGVASGQFAGEKEQGNLTPLLASPASNVAIFGGKVLAAIIPGSLFALVAELAYLGTLTAVAGPSVLRLLPLTLALAMLALVPGIALFAATVASLISSRVRTYNTAQQVTWLVLLPLWAIVYGLAVKMQGWEARFVILAIAGLFALDTALVLLAGTTWRREEVLAQR